MGKVILIVVCITDSRFFPISTCVERTAFYSIHNRLQP